MTTDKPSPPDPAASAPTLTSTALILRCFTGTFIAGTLALLIYRLTVSIAITFAQKPMVSDNPTVVNIASAVRTLVVGMTALGAGVFGMAALGLFLLGLQLIWQRLMGRSTSSSG